MGRLDNVTNEQHWENLVRKAERGFSHFRWKDFHILFDPIFYGRHGVDKKGYYRRIFQVPFLVALFGDDPVPTGLYDKDLNPVVLPRYQAVAREVVDMIMAQDEESVLAFLDSQPTVYEVENGIRPDEKPEESAAGEQQPVVL